MTTASAIGARPEGKALHCQSAEEALAHLGSSATGLSAQEAAQRLAADGPNELKEGKRISPLQIFLGQFKSLIIWILIAAGVISGLLGERVDAIAILAIVVLNAVIGFYQEFKAEKSIAALKKLTAPQASVRRVFHLDRAHIQTLMYVKLSVAGHLTIFLTRTRGPFCSIRPAADFMGSGAWHADRGDVDRGLRAVHDTPRLGLGAVRLGLCAAVVPYE